MTDPTPDDQRHHWTEANKFALEAMKALLWLNGVSVALLTLFGGSHQHPVTPDFGHAILTFAFGAAFSVFMFIWAYAVQLRFSRHGVPKKWGQWINFGSYLAMLGALGLFLYGLWWAYGAVVTSLGAS
jgi:hypothetical protein